MERVVKFCFVILCIISVSCTKPYMPEVTTVNKNVLVVEGFINVGNDSTIITLSRTQPIKDINKNNPETGALVIIESNTNEIYTLREISKGKYVYPALNASIANSYRLNIKTAKGVVYVSDYVAAKGAPPIDSLSYKVVDDGVRVYVNAHDDTNNSRYYRWEFIETWEFTSSFYSNLFWDGNGLAFRDLVNNNIYYCWKSNSINPITLGSSAKLEKDIISGGELTFLNANSEKIMRKYSVLVKQYALKKEAYEFWENLKKNTEATGSIFDAQPSQTIGNIHNISNVGEIVVGYISAGTVKEKRFFISKENLPNWDTGQPYKCFQPDTVKLANQHQFLFSSGNLIPITEILDDNGRPIAHTYSSKECVDCRVRGTNKRPAFWQ